MLVTYSNVTDVDGFVKIGIMAKAGRITRIIRANGTGRLAAPPLSDMPFLSITNCMNADGTAFTAIYQAEEESTTGTAARQARCINFDPPWRVTIVPGQPTTISFQAGIPLPAVDAAQLIVGYKYE